MIGTIRDAKMATLPSWGLPECLRWLHGQDGGYQNGSDGDIAKIGTTRVANIATWPR